MEGLLKFLQHRFYAIYKVLLFMAASALIIWLIPNEGWFQYEFQEGKPWKHKDLIAPFNFVIDKPEDQLEAEKQQVRQSFHPYYRKLDTIAAAGKQQLRDILLSDTGSSQLDNPELENLFQLYAGVYDSVMDVGIIQLDASYESNPDGQVYLIRQNEAGLFAVDGFLSISNAYNIAFKRLKKLVPDRTELTEKILEKIIQHNIRIDKGFSDSELNALLSEVSPSYGLVQEDEKIITNGEVVSSEKYRILSSLKRQYELNLGQGFSRYYLIAGKSLLVLLSFLVLYLFLRYYKKEVFEDLSGITLILLVMVSFIAATLLIVRVNQVWYLSIPFCLAPVIWLIFFDSRLSIVAHVLMVLIIGFFVPNSFQFVFMQILAGFSAIFGLRQLQKRSQLIRAIVLVFLTYSMVHSAQVLLQEADFGQLQLFPFINLAASSALILLVYPLVYILEKIFGKLTDVTLMELSNTNSELLRELSQKAPGTFQHSMQVANLAEEALFEIHGHTLLAYTGALYHDIGKMDSPSYFIENQVGGINPHDDLDFQESARIIRDHVIKGIEMARKHKLPDQIIDFIRTHHGSSRVEYFYRLEKKSNPDIEVNAREFSYPGPEPFSKETAVVMMADSIEAASRSMKNISEQGINDLVEQIVARQLGSGQFDHAPITLQEIKRVKKIFKKRLMHIYHVRIEYPS